MNLLPSLEEAGLENGRLEQLYKAYTAAGARLCTDSRQLKTGDCYAALKGERFDGHDYVQQALAAGAAMVITERPEECEDGSGRVFGVRNTLAALQRLAQYHRRQMQGLKVLAVAGSNGKTTCKELIYAVLSKHYPCHLTPGNFNNHLGVAISLLGTPPGTEWAIIEIGSNHPGELDLLCEMVEPNMGVVTSIGKEHLEGFGTMENIVEEETTLYRYLLNNHGIAVAHQDAPLLMQTFADKKIPLTYGMSPDADCIGKLTGSFPYLSLQWEFNAKALWDAPVLHTRIYGDYNFPHILAAAAIGRYLSVPYDRICDALSEWQPRNNRSEIREMRGHWLVMDAYNANPDSMRAALGHFHRMKHPHKVILLGEMLEMGEHSAYEHRFLLENTLHFDFQVVCLVGQAFWALRNEFPSFRFFEDAAALHQFLQAAQWPASAILFKGSRGNAMEQYADSLPGPSSQV
ncbi:MAG: UDP-N-acetylmuramoyl-tripeptide--D-alanyl-D-alanine ligase [Bacteroidetes bacterium]|nr:UDP-N-acetylmuramoyl-tripeptide--D-alanyl-D-alanine ligase [Bacteroidota bacterium]